MRKFFLGFVAGAATYHYVSIHIDHQEVKKELRDFIKAVDEKLAEEPEEPKTETREEPSPYHNRASDPQTGPQTGPQSEEEGRTDIP